MGLTDPAVASGSLFKPLVGRIDSPDSHEIGIFNHLATAMKRVLTGRRFVVGIWLSGKAEWLSYSVVDHHYWIDFRHDSYDLQLLIWAIWRPNVGNPDE